MLLKPGTARYGVFPCINSAAGMQPGGIVMFIEPGHGVPGYGLIYISHPDFVIALLFKGGNLSRARSWPACSWLDKYPCLKFLLVAF